MVIVPVGMDLTICQLFFQLAVDVELVDQPIEHLFHHRNHPMVVLGDAVEERDDFDQDMLEESEVIVFFADREQPRYDIGVVEFGDVDHLDSG